MISLEVNCNCSDLLGNKESMKGAILFFGSLRIQNHLVFKIHKVVVIETNSRNYLTFLSTVGEEAKQFSFRQSSCWCFGGACAGRCLLFYFERIVFSVLLRNM